MEIVEHKLNACTTDIRIDADYAYVADLADVHVGASHHHSRKFNETVSLIERTPNFYVIIGGDCTESSGIHTKSSVFDEGSHGYDQVKELRNKLRPIKDRILFVRSGNHGHERAMRDNKMAPEEILADLLDVPYFQGFGAAVVNARKNTYVISTQHNAKKPSTFGWLQGVDIMFYEHKHLNGFEREPVASVNRFTKKWMVREMLHVQAGSFLAWGGYASDRGYKPQFTGCPVIELCGKKEQWGTVVYENIDQFKRAAGIR
jgi:predicted MPP superfamily phosphohydrolase